MYKEVSSLNLSLGYLRIGIITSESYTPSSSLSVIVEQNDKFKCILIHCLII